MNTREKIERAKDTSLLCLHKEGVFYKLYNQHAMLFTENIKELKIQAKFIKVVNQHVYSSGFPASIIEDIKKQLIAHGAVINESEKLLTATNIHREKENDYSRWCELQQQAAATAAAESVQGLTDIEKKIAAFQVMRKTPLDAMNFIIGLQEELHNSNE